MVLLVHWSGNFHVLRFRLQSQVMVGEWSKTQETKLWSFTLDPKSFMATLTLSWLSLRWKSLCNVKERQLKRELLRFLRRWKRGKRLLKKWLRCYSKEWTQSSCNFKKCTAHTYWWQKSVTLGFTFHRMLLSLTKLIRKVSKVCVVIIACWSEEFWSAS